MRPAAAAFAICFLAAPAVRADPEISTLQVALQGRDVQANFQLEDGFREELVRRINSGLPSGFTYQFRLYRDHKRWFDNRLAEATFQVVAMYNAVTEEYLINTKKDGELIESRTAHSVEELERAMTRFEGLQLFAVPEITEDVRLLVRARVDLGSQTSFFFIPTRDHTGWARSRKFRPPTAGS